MKRSAFFILLFFLLISVNIFFFRNSDFFKSLQSHIQLNLENPLKNSFKFRTSLQDDNKTLKKLVEENNSLKKNLIDQAKIKADNIALRSQFDNSNIKASDLIAAEVVGFRGLVKNPEVLIINKGEEDEVLVSMAVILDKSLVGKISKTSPHFSEVIVTTSKQFKTIGKVVGKESFGITSGQDDFIFFDRVAITDSLQEGDIIVTKGDVDINGIGIPPEYIIGTVSKINKKENKPFQSAELKAPFKISNITNVFIVKSN